MEDERLLIGGVGYGHKGGEGFGGFIRVDSVRLIEERLKIEWPIRCASLFTMAIKGIEPEYNKENNNKTKYYNRTSKYYQRIIINVFNHFNIDVITKKQDNQKKMKIPNYVFKLFKAIIYNKKLIYISQIIMWSRYPSFADIFFEQLTENNDHIIPNIHNIINIFPYCEIIQYRVQITQKTVIYDFNQIIKRLLKYNNSNLKEIQLIDPVNFFIKGKEVKGKVLANEVSNINKNTIWKVQYCKNERNKFLNNLKIYK